MIVEYNRLNAINYAKKWALSRNPKYFNFDQYALGGDCTNFVSQCLFAGSGVMNYKKTFGWYYISLNNRSPAWTGVEELYSFLTKNKGAGPYGKELPLGLAIAGDIIQLSFDGKRYGHSLFIMDKVDKNPENIMVATHTYDSINRPLSSYYYKSMRLIHIEAVRRFPN